MTTPGSVSRKETLTWCLCIAILFLGWLTFAKLPRIADPEIPVQEVRVITPYPGASAAEVEREVSIGIEQATMGLAPRPSVTSLSSRGLSVVSVRIPDDREARTLPRIRDELRHRIDGAQPDLPPGAGPSVIDGDQVVRRDFYYALTGAGFTPAEHKRVAELLRRELSILDGVGEAILFGEEQEILYIEISRTKTRTPGLDTEAVLDALQPTGLRIDAGSLRVGPERISLVPGELYRSEQELGDLMIAAGRDRLVRLGDLAEIRRGYQEPPRRLLRFNGRPAIGIAVSTAPRADVPTVGEALERRLAELTADMPLGMELEGVTNRSEATEQASDRLNSRLALALAMILTASSIVLGLRGGLLVGFITLLSLAGTFLVMRWLRIALDPVSMGALVVATGLIPGSAISMIDRMRWRSEGGESSTPAALGAVSENALPLLAATGLTVLAFTPIALAENSTGEYLRNLALVVIIAVIVGWIAAVIASPLLGERYLRSGTSGTHSSDSRGGPLLRAYIGMAAMAIRYRRITLVTIVLLIASSLYGFGFVPRGHLPMSSAPGILVEVHLREGTHIRETERRMEQVRIRLGEYEGITRVVTAVGARHPSGVPSSSSGPDTASGYGASLVSVRDPRRADALRIRIQADLDAQLPDALVNVKRLTEPPEAAGGGIQLRISGPDPGELRALADRVKALIRRDPAVKAVRDDWGAKAKIAQPVLARERVRRLGIDRSRIADALRTSYSGTRAGLFRDGADLILILVRSPQGELGRVEDMAEIQVVSPLRGDRVTMRQLVERLDTRTEDAKRYRRDGIRVISVHADANRGSAVALLKRIRPRVEHALDAGVAADIDANPDNRIPLQGKPGYFIAWGGEAERMREAKSGLWTWVPPCLGLMALILIALFGDLRRPLIVLLSASPAMVGATAGLLLAGHPFDVPALLGVLGLSGVLTGMAILLLDEMVSKAKSGAMQPPAGPYAADGRLRPVGLAAGTGILAWLPLLVDDRFGSMAVTMVSGLAFATLLIPILVPVLYTSLFRIRGGNAESSGATGKPPAPR